MTCALSGSVVEKIYAGSVLPSVHLPVKLEAISCVCTVYFDVVCVCLYAKLALQFNSLYLILNVHELMGPFLPVP